MKHPECCVLFVVSISYVKFISSIKLNELKYLYSPETPPTIHRILNSFKVVACCRIRTLSHP